MRRRVLYPKLALLSLPVACLVLDAAPAPAGRIERRSGRIERIEHPPSHMVRVSAGEFKMGLSEHEQTLYYMACQREFGVSDYMCQEDWWGMRNVHERVVNLDAFDIDRHEVTTGQYRECVSAARCDIAALLDGDERYLRDDLPMVNVTWQDATDFCAWMGKRLPTEAEWEKAARGTHGARWPWGNQERDDGSNHGKVEDEVMVRTHGLVPHLPHSPPTIEYAPDNRDGYLYAAPPGALRWGDSPYGVFDMAGNVSEWVEDYYDFGGYDDLDLANPVRTSPGDRGLRTVRGGSWAEPRVFGRTYARQPATASSRQPWRGFRCARSVR